MKKTLFTDDGSRIICLIFFVIFSAGSAFPLNGMFTDAVKEIERKKFETELKLRERERINLVIEQNNKDRNNSQYSMPDDGIKFMIKKIVLKNDNLLGSSEKKTLISKYVNRLIGHNDITLLVQNITNLLIDKGYITARVAVPVEQNLKSGVLILEIVNGYISKIKPEGNTVRERMQVFTAFPFLEGKILNIKDLDYGIEQMNRLRSNDASMKIFPGEKTGESDIIISNNPGCRLFFDAGMDNLGQKNTGVYRRRLSAGIDDLLSINDNIYFDHSGTLKADDGKSYNRSYTCFFSAPFGCWTFSSSVNRSEYLQYVCGLNRNFETGGTGNVRSFSVSRLLGRYRLNRLKGEGSITLKRKKTYIEDAEIESSSRNLSVLKTGIEYSTFICKSYFTLAPSYHRGIAGLKAYRDPDDLPDDYPRAQFKKYEADMIWSIPFNLSGQNFSYLIKFSGQYGADTLYSSEKISLGNLNTVRGFKSESLTGDRGFYIRNDLAVYDFSSLADFFRGLKITAGYDYGYAVEKSGRESNGYRGEGSIMGCSAGVEYSSEVFDFNIVYSRKLFSPWFIDENEHVIYFTFKVNVSGTAYGLWKAAIF